MATLMADMTAPTELTEEQSARVRNHPTVRRLAKKSQGLTTEIRRRGYRSVKDGEGTPLYSKKKETDAALNRQRTEVREKLRRNARKKHFRTADTIWLNSQLGGRSPLTPQKANHA